jgi:hypothetical protein
MLKAAQDPAPTTGAIDLDDLHTVEGLVSQHREILTVPTLRWQLRHRDTNGLASACVRVGKKLLISRQRYEAWLGAGAGGPA